MGSTRLPGKSLMLLAGGPLVGRVIERVQRATRPEKVILAIPDTEKDRCLRRLAEDYRVPVFAGPENDLVERYYRAASLHGLDIVVRIPADNPCPEPWLIDATIDYHLQSGNDFSSSYPDGVFRHFPEGMGCEVYNFGTLVYLRENFTDPEWREHPHKGIYANPGLFRIGAPELAPHYRRPDLVLHINTHEQYSLMARLYDDLFREGRFFGIEEVIGWWDSRARHKAEG